MRLPPVILLPHLTISSARRNQPTLLKLIWPRGTIAMHAMYCYRSVARELVTANSLAPTLPSIHIYSDLPREWPMARLCISYKQVNRYLRTVIWRRVAEHGLRGAHFANIPQEIRKSMTGDLLMVSIMPLQRHLQAVVSLMLTHTKRRQKPKPALSNKKTQRRVPLMR